MIKIQDLQFGYSKKRKLFDNLSLTLKPGHIYGLLGKNGTGKTTLLKIIGGMLFPNSGTLEVQGFVPAKREPSFLKDIFFIPEDIYTSDITIKDFIAANAPFYPKFDLGSFLGYIKEFEIGFDANLSKISYGQKKKVIIAFGLATNCTTLILDEPTNGLDIPSKSQFRKIVASVATEERIIIISTHQVRDLDNLIDTVIIIDEGKISLFEPVDTIMERLVFKTVEEELAASAIYGESSLKGVAGVFVNNGTEHSRFDMELLFNATLAQKEAIRKVFNEKIN